MKEIYSNINIVGGGLIGASLAYSLSKLGYKITVVEKNKAHNPKNYNDHRTVAISEGTKNFLSKIDLWNDIKNFAQPIKRIEIIDRKVSNKINFDNERRNSNLGYIVKNKNLMNILYKKIKAKKNVTIFNDVILKSFQKQQETINTNLQNKTIVSDLNIAADGKNSFVKQIFKTPSFNKNYNKSALVVSFNHTKDHKDTAFEFFYKNGPLAILPMQSMNENFTSSIVWTHNNNYLSKLLKIEDDKFKSILNEQTQSKVGKIKKTITKQLFPLSAHINTTFYENRTIYIGDAAHSFHPIAGQGWNLGMKDVENLYELVKKYKLLGLDIGNKFFCKEYHNNNFYAAYRLYQVTDKLDNIFQIQNPLFSIGRSLGINLLQKNKKINNLISDFAMGVN